jgi:hypothetical protein
MISGKKNWRKVGKLLTILKLFYVKIVTLVLLIWPKKLSKNEEIFRKLRPLVGLKKSKPKRFQKVFS